MTNAHHDATAHHKRSRCETKFFSTKKRSDDDVSSSFHLPIGLHNDAIAKPVEQQRLLGFGKTEFPWHASMFQRRQWRSTSSTIVSRNQHNIGFCFAYACGNSSDSNFRHQLHMHSSGRVRILQVVNELLQIFNGVDVMVRWWRNKPNTRGAVTRFCDPRIHLVPR